ncbi:hypothetical protein [Streptomyces poriferorum]|uniref:Uncharacterized protein n=1 Tax=Streptomyces poriferorum TaxID=2798799 RepID=A0ABY9J152_9ACTN|nr:MULTISPECIES: hypothetical protein [unclassified Streptomyces]MDP5310445.1 hypothetical protein [Streptomyces sp. Alt4]WLQ60401.1 hypothetical protein P8A19_35480 [Streptomyces sp. Alt2]
MSTPYRLQLTLDGTALSLLTIEGDTTADLAQAVHRHARGHLGSHTVTIHIAENGLTGTVLRGQTSVGTFALGPDTATTPANHAAEGDGIRWGYSLADINHVAAAACTADRSLAGDMTIRYDIAWSAIALALTEATEPPTQNDLTRAGWQAIYAEVRETRHLYGIPRDMGGEVASAPRFAAYWRPTSTDSSEDRLIDGIAIHQIIDTLTTPYRDAVNALAVHGDYRAAAHALGIEYKALIGRIGTARRAARNLWFAPEIAPPNRGTDRRVGAYDQARATHCGAGHEWTPENTRMDAGRSPGRHRRRCRSCEREHSQRRKSQARDAA